MHRGSIYVLLGTALLLHACAPTPDSAPPPDTAPAAPDGDWRAGGVCYEIFVRSFMDSDGDGIGDLEGLIRKLDYVNDGNPATTGDLGANCIWLMPISPASSYHGYDVNDYYDVDRAYGTIADFERLIAETRRRGIRVIIDMVINHSSGEHPFFRHALLHQDSPYRDWYIWGDGPGAPNEWGGFNWHRSPFSDEYYYGFFWSGMPDLNWETPAVREEMKRVATFWLRDLGAGGLRLDAVRHLLEDGDRTANVPGTHDALREYGAHIRAVAPDAFTIGEVFDSTDVLMAYYPDQLDAYFAFEISNAILEAVRGGSSTVLLDKVIALQAAVPAERWAPFLRNHDQTRTMTFFEGDTAQARLAAQLLLTLPGIPFVYYGEEIGMTGDKPDPRLRTPMHWDRTGAAGFTTGVPWEPLQPDSFSANVQVLEADPGSLLHVYRRMIHLRAANRALGGGELVRLDAGNAQVVAFLRTTGSEHALVVANLGTSALADVALSASTTPLAAGRYAAEVLTGEVPVAPVEVGATGRIEGWAVPVLAPRAVGVFRLNRSN